jgi:hypothetical protein
MENNRSKMKKLAVLCALFVGVSAFAEGPLPRDRFDLIDLRL